MTTPRVKSELAKSLLKDEKMCKVDGIELANTGIDIVKL